MSHPLLTAPIGRSLLLLAGPTTALMLVQVFVAIADGIFVGRLGTDALAGMALVIPFVTLMFNIANGGMGGGVASAVARALGAVRLDDAQAIVLHSLILAAALGASFAVLDWVCAAWLFQLLGGSGAEIGPTGASTTAWCSPRVSDTGAFCVPRSKGASGPAQPASTPTPAIATAAARALLVITVPASEHRRVGVLDAHSLSLLTCPARWR